MTNFKGETSHIDVSVIVDSSSSSFMMHRLKLIETPTINLPIVKFYYYKTNRALETN